MHRKACKLWRTSYGARISSASTTVTMLTPLFSMVLGGFYPPEPTQTGCSWLL
jgi:hypothetical protein